MLHLYWKHVAYVHAMRRWNPAVLSSVLFDDLHNYFTKLSLSHQVELFLSNPNYQGLYQGRFYSTTIIAFSCFSMVEFSRTDLQRVFLITPSREQYTPKFFYFLHPQTSVLTKVFTP